MFLWNSITSSWFHFKLSLEHKRMCAWIEKLFAEITAFVMILWNDTIELFSFQTLLIKPLDCCPYRTRVPKPLVLHCFFEMKPLYIFFTRCHFKLCFKNLWIVARMKKVFRNHWFCCVSLKWQHFINVWNGFIPNFAYTTCGFLPLLQRVFQNHRCCIVFFQMKPLSVFLKWFHFKLCLYFCVWLNIWEIQLQKHWFYNGCITNNDKSIAFISKTNLRTTQKILVKWTDIKSVQKLSQTHQKSNEIQTGVGGLEKWSQHVFLISDEICWSDIWMKRAQNKTKLFFFSLCVKWNFSVVACTY